MHLTPNMYKIITVKANAKKIITEKCIWCQICTKLLLERQILRKSSRLNVSDTKYVQNHYFEGKCSENCYLNMHVAPHMFKTITLKANAKDIMTVKCIWTKYVQNHYFEGKCSGNHYLKMHLVPHMYKTVTLKATAQEIVTLKCMWLQICTKLLLWRQMLRKSSLENVFDTKYVQKCYFEGKCWGNCNVKMHLTPNMYTIMSLKTNAKEIVTFKWFWCQICTKSLLWRQMLMRCTTLKDPQRSLDMERWLTPGEILFMKDLLPKRVTI